MKLMVTVSPAAIAAGADFVAVRKVKVSAPVPPFHTAV
jgi:hypothetical protein